MRREIMIAKLRKQQEELQQMLNALEEEKTISPGIKNAFLQRLDASEKLIETLQDKSIIPNSQVDFNVTNEIKTIENLDWHIADDRLA